MEEESVIRYIFHQLEQEKDCSKEYKEIRKKYGKKREEFEELLSNEQKYELQEVIDLVNELSRQEIEEFFVDGFKLGIKIMTETFKKE